MTTEFCPICDNNGGVHGKCMACGRPQWSKLHLGDARRTATKPVEPETKEAVDPCEEPYLAAEWWFNTVPDTNRDVQVLLRYGDIVRGWYSSVGRCFHLYGVLGLSDADYTARGWVLQGPEAEGIRVKAWRELP